MSKVVTCDVCGKPTEKIILKIFKAPKHSKTDHSNYTHHADVGICCAVKINEIRWQERVKRPRRAAIRDAA